MANVLFRRGTQEYINNNVPISDGQVVFNETDQAIYVDSTINGSVVRKRYAGGNLSRSDIDMTLSTTSENPVANKVVTNAIGDLPSLQTDVKTNLVGAINEVNAHADTAQSNIDTEATARANADTTLQGNIDAEATARANADATLQNNIDAEATARANAITAEATARQTADNTLQGNINSEASTRASADSNLQSQINQIIAPSGEAPSAAEVQNARIGADGVTYDTLGNAIRGQVTDLKSAINRIGLFDLLNDASFYPRLSEYFEKNGNVITLKNYSGGSNYVAINVPIEQNTNYTIMEHHENTLETSIYAFSELPLTHATNSYIGETSFSDVVTANSGNNNFLIIIFQISSVTNNTNISLSIFNSDTTIVDNYAPIEAINLFDKDKCANGYYVDYLTGNLMAIEGYSVSNYIKVEENEQYTINVGAPVNGVQQMAWYDKNGVYISGLSNEGIAFETTVLSPANSKYLRWTINNSTLDTTQIQKGDHFTGYISSKIKQIPKEYIPYENIVEVGTGKEYTSILKALKETDDKTEIHVLAGNYDVYQEYIDYYGSNFWTNYSGYSGANDDFYRGLWISNGRKIKFDPKAIIYFENNNISNIGTYFSVFATGENAEIDGANVVYSGVRYAIHDDYASKAGTNIYKNCVFDGNPAANAVIGAGCGNDNTYIIDNCVFLNNLGLHDISYHNDANGNIAAKSKIIVKNCYGHRRCAFRWYGNSQEITDCIVSSCHFGEIVCQEYDSSQPYENMRLFNYCNEVEQQQ
jgi:hypothetical protein